MKTIYIILLLILTGIFLDSCKKDTGINSTVGSLNIINATIDASPMAVNYASPSLAWSKNITQIYGDSFVEFGLDLGSNTLNLISSADTTKPFFHGSINLITGGIYSFFVAGQTSHYDTLYMKDRIPIYADSSAGARFINLSPDSQSLSINLQGNSQSEFTGLTYKKITAFKKYAATSSVTNNGGYIYEVTDASGNVLTTFNWIPAVFNKSNTLVITGLVSDGSIHVFPVNNY